MHSGNQRREHARKMVKGAGYATGGMVGLEGAKKMAPFKHRDIDGGHDGYRGGGQVSGHKTSDTEHHGHSRAMHGAKKLADGGGVGQDGGPDKKRPGGDGDHYEWHHGGRHGPPKMKEVAGGFKRGGGVENDMGKPASVHDLGYASGGLHRKRGHKPKLPGIAGPIATPPMPPVTETPPMPDAMAGGAPPGPPMGGGMAPMGGSPPMKRGGVKKR